MHIPIETCVKIRQRLERQSIAYLWDGTGSANLPRRIDRIMRWMGPGRWQATTRAVVGDDVYASRKRVRAV